MHSCTRAYLRLGSIVTILAACTEAAVGLNPDETPEVIALVTAVADVASCESQGDEATAAIVDTLPGLVLMAGDIAYESGTSDEFARCYDTSWGRHRSRTRPSPGNHEYVTDQAAPYFAYFGEAAGPAGRGYYSFDAGTWHIVSLNSNIDMSAGSPQETWLREDLAKSGARCTLAFWHHPLFSSGFHGSNPSVAPLWRALEDAGAEIVIGGHDHHYERFAPQSAVGTPKASGLRQFVTGNGGRSLYPALFGSANSERRFDEGHGVLRLTLGEGRYEWRFVPVTPGQFTDSGSGTCH